MTGLYSHQNGQRQLGKGIDTTKVFFSEILQQHGYQTGVVGKWHMQCEPKGFDYYHVLWDQGDYYNPEFKSKESNGKYVKEEGYATTLTTDHAIEFWKRGIRISLSACWFIIRLHIVTGCRIQNIWIYMRM